jgi:hypothetical protein
MNKEILEKRLLQIKQSLEQFTGQYNALMGAKQECEYWLAELAKLDISNDANDSANKADEAQK